jgi:hypothetical protein
MRKKLFLMICISCFSLAIFAQNDKNWEVNLNYAYQFQLNKFGDNLFDNKQDLHQYGVSVKRLLLDKNRFQLLGGIGYSRQQILGDVGVNHCYGEDICILIYISTKNYAIELAELPLEIRFPINDKFSVDLTVMPQFRFHQNYDYDLQSKYSFGLNSVEIYPAVSYKVQDFRFSLGGRLMNWQKPDKLFYYDYDLLEDNPDFYEQTLYRYNPLKLRLTAAYQF